MLDNFHAFHTLDIYLNVSMSLLGTAYVHAYKLLLTVHLSDRRAGLGMVMGAVVSRGGYMVSPALSTPSTSVREGVCKHVTKVREGVCNVILVSAWPDSLLNTRSAQQFSCHSFLTKPIC